MCVCVCVRERERDERCEKDASPDTHLDVHDSRLIKLSQ